MYHMPGPSKKYADAAVAPSSTAVGEHCRVTLVSHMYACRQGVQACVRTESCYLYDCKLSCLVTLLRLQT